MAVVLANSNFAPEIIQLIHQFPVTREPPAASPSKVVYPSPEVGHKPSPDTSNPDVVSVSRRNSVDESAYETRTDEHGRKVSVSRRRRRPALPTGAVPIDVLHATASLPAEDSKLPTPSP